VISSQQAGIIISRCSQPLKFNQWLNERLKWPQHVVQLPGPAGALPVVGAMAAVILHVPNTHRSHQNIVHHGHLGVFSRPRENTSCPFTDYPLWNGFSVHVGCLALRYAYSEPSVVCCRTGSEACYPYILSIVGGKIEDFLALLLLIPTAWVTRVRVCEGCYIFTGY
jgi:hypothetical protein